MSDNSQHKRRVSSISSEHRSGAATPFRMLGVARVTHKRIEIRLKSPEGSPAQYLWVTFLNDEYSKNCLATHISFNAPNYFSYISVIVACALRTRCLPSTVIVERGIEFQALALHRFFSELDIQILFDHLGDVKDHGVPDEAIIEHEN